MNKYKIKSILFSALWGMAILNSGAASCSKDKETTTKEITKELEKELEKGCEEALRLHASSERLPKKDSDDAIKIMYGKLSENEPNVSDWARKAGTKVKKTLNATKQFIFGKIIEDKLDKLLHESLDTPQEVKNLKILILEAKRALKQEIKNRT
ncbi:hypothetical protein ACRRVA_02220 [Candidatus Cardinium hertigii]|uniref:hypothetical protein n=1 Tax=Candidatus Cardinium hertigii TaxID=247481 RepID=UPI003D7E4236